MPDIDNPSDAAMLRAHADALAMAIERAIPGWVARAVADRARHWQPGILAGLAEPVEAAGAAAAGEVGARIRDLLSLDVDEQRTGPLALLRSAVSYPTAVLADAGVPPVVRDAFAERAFPDDVYDLAPASFADVDPSLRELGLVWGAAKAHVVLARRRMEER